MAITQFGSAGMSGKLIAYMSTAEAIDNTATETTINGPTIRANSVSPGTLIHTRAWGNVSSNATPTLALKQYAGATAILAPAAVTTASGMSNALWLLDMFWQILTTGASGTVKAAFFFATLANDATSGVEALQISGADSTADTLDTTAAWDAEWSGTWSVAHASNELNVLGQVTWQHN